MKIQANRTVYYCEHCGKHYLTKRRCEKHEAICQCKFCYSFIRSSEADGSWAGGCSEGIWEFGNGSFPEHPCPYRNEYRFCPNFNCSNMSLGCPYCEGTGKVPPKTYKEVKEHVAEIRKKLQEEKKQKSEEHSRRTAIVGRI